MIITFAGHGKLNGVKDLYTCVEKTILGFIENEKNIVFLCGGYGDFDLLCESVCRSIKKTRSDCEIVFVTPYITETQQKKIKVLQQERLYDAIVYPSIEKTPLKFAIIDRNRWMVDKADLVIAYIEHFYGGAYKTFQYAQKKNKKIINLYNK